MILTPQNQDKEVVAVFKKIEKIKIRSAYIQLMLKLFAANYKLKDLLNVKTQDIQDAAEGIINIPWITDFEEDVTKYIDAPEARYRIGEYFFSSPIRYDKETKLPLPMTEEECIDDLYMSLQRKSLSKSEEVTKADLKLISQFSKKVTKTKLKDTADKLNDILERVNQKAPSNNLNDNSPDTVEQPIESDAKEESKE